MIRLALLVLVLLLAPPLAHGAEVATTARAGAFFAVQVLGPGWVLASVLVPARTDRIERLALALTLGIAAQALAFGAAKAGGVDGAFAAYPLLFAPLVPACVRATRARHDGDWPIGRADGIALLVVLVVCVLRTPILRPEAWCFRQDADLLFHLGNAAEFARHWPVEDPRVAGTPLVYHLLSYALPAGAHAVLGLPVAELAARSYAAVGPLVLVLSTFAAARALGGSARAGAIAAALVALHTDLAFALRAAFGLNAPALLFQNHFDAGVFQSATTRAGLAAFAALVPVGIEWFRGGSARWRLAVAAALLAAFASGAKGSVLPIVAAGLGFAVLVESVRARRVPRSALAFLAVVLVAGAPITLWLVSAESSYAGAMFRVAPMTPMRSAGPFVALANHLGHEALLAPWWLVAVCAPLWWTLHAGAALVGACVALGRRAPALDTASLWLFGTAIAGVAAASTVAAAGYSELFFAYDGHLALAILAGVAVDRAVHARRGLALAVFLAFAAPLAAGGLARTYASVRDVAQTPPEPALARAYRAGLEWIRDASPPDAVFATSGEWTNVSAFGERRAFLESERFTPAWHAARWQRVAGRWVRLRAAEHAASARLVARDALYTGLGAESVARAREWIPAAPLYLVSDRLAAIPGPGCAVGPAPDAAHLRSNPLLEPVFANEAVAIYRVR